MRGLGRLAMAVAMAFALVACGGGGGGSTVTGPSGTLSITSQPVATTLEGNTGTVYTATSTDSAGAAVTYSLSGPDAAQFNINASTGAISFKSAPSFAAPTDATQENNYVLTLAANDGTLTAHLPIAIVVAQNITTPRAYTFTNAPFGGGGFVSGLIYHPTTPNLLYARTDVGGAFRWNPTNQTWIPLTDFIGRSDSQLTGVISLALDPNDSTKVYLATGQYLPSWAQNAAIFRSSDQGVTWSRTNLPLNLGGNSDGRETGERLQVDPNNGSILYLGTNQNGLWKSTDSGVTWSQVTAFTPTGVTVVAFDKTKVSGGKTSAIYVGVDNSSNSTGASVYRSTDGGVTWGAVTGAPVGLTPHHIKFDSAGTMYVTLCNGLGPNGVTNGAVYKFNTSSVSWTNISPSTPSGGVTFGYSGLGVDMKNPGVLEVATLDRWSITDDVYRSTNGGSTWTALNAKSTHQAGAYVWQDAYSGSGFNGTSITSMGFWMGALDIDPNNSANAVYGTGFGLYMTANGTAADTGGTIAWNFNVNGFEETVPTGLTSPPKGGHLITSLGDVGGARYTTLSSTDLSGYVNPPNTSNQSVDYAGQNPNFVVRTADGNPNGGYVSADNGVTWTSFGSTAETPGNYSGYAAISAGATSIVWTPFNEGAFYSTNNGATWTASTGYPTTSGGQYQPIADKAVDKVFYTYNPSTGTLYQSTDGGVTFSSLFTGLPQYGGIPLSISWSQRDLWIPTPSGLVHIAGMGATPQTLTTVQQAYGIGAGAPAPGAKYPALYLSGMVGGVTGFFRSDDEGATWVRINDANHQWGWVNLISGDMRAYGRVYLGTGGRGTIVGNR